MRWTVKLSLEARHLLQRENGDPYKISAAYVNKIFRWAFIKSNDSQSLKRLSILTKCKIALRNVSFMWVLYHAPNMQAVVSKLPPNLQNKWRDQAAKRKRTSCALRTLLNLWNQLLTLQMILYSARRHYKTGRVQKWRGTQGTLTQETASNQSTRGTALPTILIHLPMPGSYMGPGLQVRLQITLCAGFATILMTWMTVNSSRNKQQIKDEPSWEINKCVSGVMERIMSRKVV